MRKRYKKDKRVLSGVLSRNRCSFFFSVNAATNNKLVLIEFIFENDFDVL